MEIPDHLELDVSGMAIGDTLRLVDLPAQEGVTYLDDPEETVLATVTMPTVFVEPEPEEVEGEELEEGELPEGEEAPEGEEGEEGEAAEGEAAEGDAAAATSSSSPRASAPLSSGRARLDTRPARGRPRQPGPASTRARATTSAGWSSTSLPGGTTARFARSSRDSSRRSARRRARLALLKPETYMNVSGQSVGAAARFFKAPPDTLLVVHDDVDLEPGRLQMRSAVGSPGTTACARSRRRWARRSSCASASASAARAAATGARWPTTSSPSSSPRSTSRRSSRGRRTPSRRSPARASRPPSSASTDAELDTIASHDVSRYPEIPRVGGGWTGPPGAPRWRGRRP